MKAVILSSKYIEKDLSVIFGNILPIELPIQNKPLLDHQINSLSSIANEIYITIPENYQISIESDVKKIILKENLSLFEVLKEISKKFDKSDKLFIYYGDTLFTNIKKFSDSSSLIFVKKPLLNYQWGTAIASGDVPCGGFYLENKLLSSILFATKNFEEFINKLYNNESFINFSDFNWLDFGHTLTYYNSRIKFLESRYFNKIDYKNGFVIKKSDDIFKMWSEYNWLNKMKTHLPLNFPYTNEFKVTGDIASYNIEYINHPSLSDLFVFGKHSNDFFLQLLSKMKELIFKMRMIKVADTNEDISFNFFNQKMESRKNQILYYVKKLEENEKFVLNLIEKNVSYFIRNDQKYEIIHGDMCFSNILFNLSNFQPILIDPRGHIDNNNFTLFGPINYDIYKLAHSYVFGYDYIIANKYKDIFFKPESIEKRLTNFCILFNIEKEEVLQGCINLFLTMIPLHKDSPVRQKLFINILKLINSL